LPGAEGAEEAWESGLPLTFFDSMGSFELWLRGFQGGEGLISPLSALKNPVPLFF
jgi:hypothetical protein